VIIEACRRRVSTLVISRRFNSRVDDLIRRLHPLIITSTSRRRLPQPSQHRQELQTDINNYSFVFMQQEFLVIHWKINQEFLLHEFEGIVITIRFNLF